MAIRVRKNGDMLCAAINPEQDGDTYIDDALHYSMSVEHGVICTYPEPNHSITGGQWFWSSCAPRGCDMTFAKILPEAKNENG